MAVWYRFVLRQADAAPAAAPMTVTSQADAPG
jgi:hypothetical protein